MRRFIRTTGWIAVSALAMSPALPAQNQSAEETDPTRDEATADQSLDLDKAISHWVEPAQKAARDMKEQYGEPDEISNFRAVWFSNGPWKRTMVVNEAVEHNFPEPHEDVLYQTVDYAVPQEHVADLIEFSGSLLIDRVRGEVTVRCQHEEANRVTLNLAHQIIEGLKDPKSARDTLAEVVLEDEHQDMVERLFFTPRQQAGRDPDVEYGARERDDDQEKDENKR